MEDLMQEYEEEKTKLNELGQKSLEQGIPLGANEEVQAQSRKVDGLVIQFYLKKSVERANGPINVACEEGERYGFSVMVPKRDSGAAR